MVLARLSGRLVHALDTYQPFLDTLRSRAEEEGLSERIVTPGSIGDGKIFVIPVEEAIRVRTRERGSDAL